MTAEAIPGSGAQVAQVAQDFQWDGNKLEVGAAIAASGGGFRAMLFHVRAFAAVRAFSGLTESAVFSLCWICDSTFVSNRHGGCDG